MPAPVTTTTTWTSGSAYSNGRWIDPTGARGQRQRPSVLLDGRRRRQRRAPRQGLLRGRHRGDHRRQRRRFRCSTTGSSTAINADGDSTSTSTCPGWGPPGSARTCSWRSTASRRRTTPTARCRRRSRTSSSPSPTHPVTMWMGQQASSSTSTSGTCTARPEHRDERPTVRASRRRRHEGTSATSAAAATRYETGNKVVDWDGATGRAAPNFFTLKDFDRHRDRFFRYAIFVHQTNSRAATNDCTTGSARASPALISSSRWAAPRRRERPAGPPTPAGFGRQPERAGRHAHARVRPHARARPRRRRRINNKPNYLSVMNYSFQACSVTAAPPVLPGGCDYSRIRLPI